MHSALEAMLRRGQYACAVAEGERWFREHPEADPEQSAWVALLCARACASLNDWNRAFHWVRQGEKYGSSDLFIRGNFHLLAATALMLRDLRQSEFEFAQFDRIVGSEPRLDALIGDALYNRAYAKRLSMDLPAEVVLFQAAAHAYRQQGRLGRAHISLFEAGWSWLLANCTDEAMPMLEAARLGEHLDMELHWDLCIAEALRLRLLGSLVQSSDVCRRLEATDALLSRQAADVAWIAGCNALDLGESQQAQHLATLAKMLAIDVWWPPQLRRIEGFYARVMRAGGASV